MSLEKLKNDKDSTVWLFRNNSHGDYSWKLLGCEYGFGNRKRDEGYVTIGCISEEYPQSEFIRINRMDASLSQKRGEHYSVYRNEVLKNLKKVPNYCSYLYYYLYEMMRGDFLLIPSGGYICVYEIESDIMFYSDINEESVFRDIEHEEFHEKLYYRKVKKVTDRILRRDYVTGALSSATKYQGTVLRLSDEAKAQLNLGIEYSKIGQPITLSSFVLKSLKKNVFDEIDESLQNALSDNSFEEMICEFFEKKLNADFSRVMPKNPSGKSGEEDSDVEAVFETIRVKIWAQLKYFDGKADLDDAINQIESYYEKHMSDTENKGYTILLWVVTTATVTNKEKYENNKVRIIDGVELTELLINEGIRNL